MGGRYVALLRGINVGTAKRVAMDDLRTLVEDLGYSDVRTLLNSGNVVFGAPGDGPGAAADRIGEALAARLGVTSRVVVLSADEVAAAVAENPFLAVASNPSRLLVAVLANPAHRARLGPLERQEWSPEALAVGGRVAYLWCPAGVGASPLSEAVGSALGGGVTARNWTTMTKLAALVQKPGR